MHARGAPVSCRRPGRSLSSVADCPFVLIISLIWPILLYGGYPPFVLLTEPEPTVTSESRLTEVVHTFSFLFSS